MFWKSCKLKFINSIRPLLRLFILFFFSIFFTWIFYSNFLSTKLEDIIYDLKVSLKPSFYESQTVLVEISKETFTDNIANNNSKENLVKEIIDKVIHSSAKVIGVILPHQDFDYFSDDVKELFILSNKYSFLYFGLYDVFSNDSFNQYFQNFPRVLDVSSYKKYRLEVIREYPIYNRYRETFARKIAFDLQTRSTNKINTPEKQHGDSIKLNYFNPNKIKRYNALDVLKKDHHEQLKNKIVLIGYKIFNLDQ